MAKVKSLNIYRQSGADNTVFAQWAFDIPTSTVVSYNEAKLKVGSKVSIVSGSKYYNGVDIPDWVEAKQWIVKEISGDRVIIDKSVDGKNAICSPINAKNLKVMDSGTTSTIKEKDTLDHYIVTWKYGTGDGVWFAGSSSTTTDLVGLYSIPSNAIKVKVFVKPVSKTYKVNVKTIVDGQEQAVEEERSYWTGVAVSTVYTVPTTPPDKPSGLEVTIEGNRLKAVVDGIEDPKADRIYFEVIRDALDETTKKFKTGYCDVRYQRASFSCDINIGYAYRVRCRAAYGINGTYIYSDWTTYSDQQTTIPSNITASSFKCRVESKDSVKLSWSKVTTATSYEIEYTTNTDYFDKSSEVQSTSTESNEIYITGLDTGEKWFFRIRAVNEKGISAWLKPISTILGTTPEAPTTWSSSTTGMVGGKVTLYWVHNSEDMSAQTGARIFVQVGVNTQTIPLEYTPSDEDEENPIYSYELDLSGYSDGDQIYWSIRTKGIMPNYGEYSTTRTITVYAPPTLELHLGEDLPEWLWDTFNFETGSTETAHTGEYLERYPYFIQAISGPQSDSLTGQKPVCYRIVITAKDTYETEDIFGKIKIVNAGSEVYAKTYYSSQYIFGATLEAGDVELENNQEYRVKVTVTMSSGLTASDSGEFIVNWYGAMYEPDARITISHDTLSAYIAPYYLNDEEVLDDRISLSVYRREYDGSFTEIATDIENDGVMTVVDPHPALDYARYRIVARNKNTGVCGFNDLPGMPIHEPSIVIQWDDKWTEFDYSEEGTYDTPPWTGSMVKLPYNIDITESRDPEVSLIKYVGRKNPVSYYGTQRGETAGWSTIVPKHDKETIYALRRLSDWMGNVYVREPSGVGYWAHIKVAISINHLDLHVPVTFTITRVEGGM